jgi:shikimate kinase
MSDERTIALVGLMGAGKSTVARLVALRLGGDAVDLDAIVEDEAGRSIAEIIHEEGEPSFRRREAAALRRVLEDPPAVIACGGGAVLDPDSRERLRDSCRVVWLEVSPLEALRRMGANLESRPLLLEGAKLEPLLRGREVAYREASEIRVETDGLTPDEVADSVLEAVAREQA